MDESEMKASSLTTETILNFLRLAPAYVSDEDKSFISLCHKAALTHISDTLALSVEEIDEKPNLAIACLVLIRDMYDNRSVTIDKSNPNRTVDSIFGLYDHNLL